MKQHLKDYLVRYLIAAVLAAPFFSSCKKDGGSNPTPPPVNGKNQLSDADSLKYLMYHIMQVSYINGGRDSSYDLTYLLLVFKSSEIKSAKFHLRFSGCFIKQYEDLRH